MCKRAVLFDLDGTLTDSSEGITKCAALALNHFGIAVNSLDELRVFVGPPLRDTFVEFGIAPSDVEEAITIFRSRYNTVGKFENTPYSGIHSLLETLQQDGCRLFVATSKPETTAIEILNKFELSQYYEEICGATMDISRETKDAVIAYLLNKIDCVEKAVMVGDTAFDVRGAAAHCIPTIGVSWGFGSTASMQEAGAIAIADTPDQLLQLLQEG